MKKFIKLSEKGETGSKHSTMLDEMANPFYDDLLCRMQSFFASGGEPRQVQNIMSVYDIS
ncbi:hypothetical protein OAL09_11715 [Verrucomicrobia bacterium]|nr:hypothetical protein [Verrucomicrobiota bacterium]